MSTTLTAIVMTIGVSHPIMAKAFDLVVFVTGALPRAFRDDYFLEEMMIRFTHSAKVVHKPRLLSDNGSSYIAGDLAEYLADKGMKHIRGAPMHPQTQGKIERWHQTLKNRILLENYFLEGELEAAIAAFIDHYNNHRYHESIANLTPADVYFGPGETILAERRRIKHKTIQNRRLKHHRKAA